MWGRRPSGCEAFPPGWGFPHVEIEITRAMRCGIACTLAKVRLADGRSETPSPAFVESHQHEHSGPDHAVALHQHASHELGQHHHLPELLAILERAPLSDWTRERAMRAFRMLCEEEGRVHGVSAEAVALHEVGAMDAMIDIVGGIEGFERLGVQQVLHPASRLSAMAGSARRTA